MLLRLFCCCSCVSFSLPPSQSTLFGLSALVCRKMNIKAGEDVEEEEEEEEHEYLLVFPY